MAAGPPPGSRPRAAIAHGDCSRGRFLAACGRVGSLGPGVHMCAAQAAERRELGPCPCGRGAHQGAGPETPRRVPVAGSGNRHPCRVCRGAAAEAGEPEAMPEVPEALPEARQRFRRRGCRCRWAVTGNGSVVTAVATCGTSAWPEDSGSRPRAAIAHGDCSRGRFLAACGRVGSLGPGVHMCAAQAAERRELGPCPCGRGAHQLNHTGTAFRCRVRRRPSSGVPLGGSCRPPVGARFRKGCRSSGRVFRTGRNRNGSCRWPRGRRSRHGFLPAERNHSTAGAKAPQARALGGGNDDAPPPGCSGGGAGGRRGPAG